ncbi:microtubule cross-linking factor 3-like [Chroicocephalus ridibundus]|uniref:microtubule cross-linking factor 3-like n=1 Tax=Chroicocephalus ridibundus TaxID=1192867 RepID=UPI002FDD6E0C
MHKKLSRVEKSSEKAIEIAKDFVTCGPAPADLRAPPRAEDAPGRRRRAPASRPRRRLPLPPPESRAASVGGAAGLQAGLSARWADERPRRLPPSGHRRQPREGGRRRRPDPLRAAWQLRPGRGRGGRGRARSGERGSGGGMWMLAVALLHSISHGLLT